MHSKKIILIGVLALIILTAGVFMSDLLQTNTETAQNTTSTTTEERTEQHLAENASFTSNHYGFSFIYPNDWRIVDNDLTRPGGTVQIFNYPASITPEGTDGFPDNVNKIEITVTEGIDNTPNGLYPEKEVATQTIMIAGQTSIRSDTTLPNGQQVRSYAIPIRNMSTSFIRATIYGNPDNFQKLDALVNSITWD